jgi:hypothetical protein
MHQRRVAIVIWFVGIAQRHAKQRGCDSNVAFVHNAVKVVTRDGRGADLRPKKR